jgi:hypothetical protein
LCIQISCSDVTVIYRGEKPNRRREESQHRKKEKHMVEQIATDLWIELNLTEVSPYPD